MSRLANELMKSLDLGLEVRISREKTDLGRLIRVQVAELDRHGRFLDYQQDRFSASQGTSDLEVSNSLADSVGLCRWKLKKV